MEGRIAAFWLIVYVVLWLLRLRPESVISRAAFSWIGPSPLLGQAWAQFQMRWAMYSFGWLCQFALVFSVLWFLVSRSPDLYSEVWFQVFWFALPLGAGVALLASVGFLFRAAKARYIGPNPIWTGQSNEDAERSGR